MTGTRLPMLDARDKSPRGKNQPTDLKRETRFLCFIAHPLISLRDSPITSSFAPSSCDRIGIQLFPTLLDRLTLCFFFSSQRNRRQICRKDKTANECPVSREKRQERVKREREVSDNSSVASIIGHHNPISETRLVLGESVVASSSPSFS